jgi:hypothetical protein
MSLCIVVARYNENIEWTNQFPNVIIYNKGSKIEEKYNQVVLENVGREGHTYYKYICDNYDTLEDYTIFLQGNPFDHSPNILEILNTYCNKKDLNIDFEFISESIHYSYFILESIKYYQCINIFDTYKRVFGVDCDIYNCIFGSGAQFIVSKNKILQRPKSFYENIVKILEYTVDPMEGYDIERFHKYIFM